jgi:hypothetical protein
MTISELRQIIAELGPLCPALSTGPMPSDEVLELETTVGALPALFKDFLLTVGGVYILGVFGVTFLQPYPHCNIPFKAKMIGCLEKFNAELNCYRSRMPACFLPISNLHGDLFCLNLGELDFGKVYYWDHRDEPDPEAYAEFFGMPTPAHLMYENVYLVANSFEEMWQQVYVTEEWEDCVPQPEQQDAPDSSTPNA